MQRFFYKWFILFALNVTFLVPMPLQAAKTLIMTHSFNRPEFIPWQYQTFKKFFDGDFEFVVFNDAPNETLSAQIEDACKQLNIACIRVPQIIHSLPYLFRDAGIGGPSAECAETIQYMLNSVGFRHEGIVMVVDSDMFLVRRLNAEKYLEGHEIASNPQIKTSPDGSVASYFLPNLMFFNMDKIQDKGMFNFNLGVVNGVRTDAGGFNHYYIERHPDLKWLKTDVAHPPLNETTLQSHADVLAELNVYPTISHILHNPTYDYEFYADYSFLHFRAGSNWNKVDDTSVAKKTSMFLKVIGELLNSDVILEAE